MKLIPALGGGTATLKAPFIDAYGLWQVTLSDGAEVILSNHGMRPFAPEWRPGDVVVVRYHPSSRPYTYVRAEDNWPTSRVPKTDAQVDALYAAGKVTPVLQAGGEPFDSRRLG
ncbi:hypothetical protein AB0H43_03070 [Hamadaea sp. NPDC050747]|uniref:hypothetical protein n=1 Tax=Hamadaea sp. NPDC050747 TaxID=3155789 RepID=UPI0033DCB00E